METTITPVPEAAQSGPARRGGAPGELIRSGPARYTLMLVGLGAAGVAIGWLGPQVAASSAEVIRRR